MEKRVLLAVVLSIAVIFLSNLLFPPPAPPPGSGPGDSFAAIDTAGTADTVGTPGRADTARIGGKDSAAAEAPAGPPGMGQTELEAASAGPKTPAGDTVRVESGLYELLFTTRGAELIGARMLRYDSYAPEDPEDARVELVRPGDAWLGYRIAAAGDTVSLADRIFEVDPPSLDVGEGSDGEVLRFRYAFPNSDVRFVVTYRFHPDSYLIDVSGRLEGFGERGWAVLANLGEGLRSNEKKPSDDYSHLAYVVNGEQGGIDSESLDKIDAGRVQTAPGGPFRWVAVKNKYFLFALVAPPDGPRFGGLAALGMEQPHSARMTASLPVPAGSGGFSFEAYVGPQEYSRLEAVGQDLESVNPYGWRWLRPIIRPLVGIVMVILTWLHQNLNMAYGWVLILFGVLMRVVLFPLYQKSMRAQLAQMEVQPLVKELQTKYKDDPQKQQSEMMKLYREHKINPLAGCLPMLVPMPILFTLFFVFQGTIEFRGVPFLWLPDLSLADPLFIIPLAMGVSMFALSWIGQRGMDANPQMKMMTYVLPVVFTFMFARFPSGLNLYYTTSNLASLPQQLYLARERRAVREKKARAKATGPTHAGEKGGRPAG
jgi:YidC/Oxa1 family membrane protein insertase